MRGVTSHTEQKVHWQVSRDAKQNKDGCKVHDVVPLLVRFSTYKNKRVFGNPVISFSQIFCLRQKEGTDHHPLSLLWRAKPRLKIQEKSEIRGIPAFIIRNILDEEHSTFMSDVYFHSLYISDFS